LRRDFKRDSNDDKVNSFCSAERRLKLNKVFKSALANVDDAAAELRAVLPSALVAHLDWKTLAPVPGTFIDEVMKGAYADLLFTVKYQGKPVLLYVLCEHKSEVDKWTLLQLLRYMVRIWEQVLSQKPVPVELPVIIPVIVHHSESGWTAATRFQELFGLVVNEDAVLRRLTPDFEAVVDDISHRSDAELRARDLSPQALLGFLFLRDGRREGRVLEELEAWADLIRAVLATPNGRSVILQLLSYLTKVAPNLGLKELAERVRRTIPETEEVVMTLAEQLIQQGRNEERTEGRTRQCRMVRRQLELKFGPLSDDSLSRLDAADEDGLERYAERVLTAATINEVLCD
jgi:predicted transposase YdaD